MNDTVPALRWTSAALSDPGMVRKVNEDACMARQLPQSGLWVVADGMGGHHAGDVASQMIVGAMQSVGWHGRLDDLIDDVRRRLEDVNRQLVQMSTAAGHDTTIGSTVAAFMSVRRQAACLWVGDSRVYRYRDGRLERLTRDHSEVEEMIERGELTREEAEFHPSANVITRAVGAGPELEAEVCHHELRHNDRFLVCSDGLFKELSEADIETLMPRGECTEVCRTLVDTALARGARDNVSVVVAEFAEARGS